jgi:hypothetical protein
MFAHFGMLYQGKSGNPGSTTHNVCAQTTDTPFPFLVAYFKSLRWQRISDRASHQSKRKLSPNIGNKWNR